jgi:hypothetical protein
MQQHSLSRAQRLAVQVVMQQFIEDDLAAGLSRSVLRCCSRCRRQRPAPGGITYGAAWLCNRCATGYELARLRHDPSADSYL